MKKTVAIILSLLLSSAGFSQPVMLKSPDGKLKVQLEIGDQISYSVTHEETEVVTSFPISMSFSDGTALGKNPKLGSQKKNSVSQTITTQIYKESKIQDVYNELVLTFRDNYALIFRAYDQGVTYWFVSTSKDELFIQNEGVILNFGHDKSIIVPYVRDFDRDNFDIQFFNSFENTYSHLKLSELDQDRMMFLPLVVELNDGKKLCFTEADLESYPGLYLINQTENTSLTGLFAPYPKKTVQGGHNELQQIVTEQEGYIAKIKGPRNFPWRVLAVATNDKELLNNDLVYQLASPSCVADTSWVKPDKVVWNWWNDWNIYGVDFRAGINNETYRYYIDFASEQGKPVHFQTLNN
jgi:alpha-glucosidase